MVAWIIHTYNTLILASRISMCSTCCTGVIRYYTCHTATLPSCISMSNIHCTGVIRCCTCDTAILLPLCTAISNMRYTSDIRCTGDIRCYTCDTAILLPLCTAISDIRCCKTLYTLRPKAINEISTPQVSISPEYNPAFISIQVMHGYSIRNLFR